MDVLTVSVKTAQTFEATTIREKGYLYHIREKINLYYKAANGVAYIQGSEHTHTHTYIHTHTHTHTHPHTHIHIHTHPHTHTPTHPHTHTHIYMCGCVWVCVCVHYPACMPPIGSYVVTFNLLSYAFLHSF